MLTLVIIARDEADRIGRALDSVPFATRRLVLDSGSADDTVAIAHRCGAEVLRTDWPGFVAQKNRALDAVRTEWALSLDADEWLTERGAAAIRAFLADPRADGATLIRENRWLGRPVRHGRWGRERKLRLVRIGTARWVGDDPHDRLESRGAIAHLDAPFGHEPYRGFGDHLRTIDRYSRIQAEALHARGVRARPWDPALHASWHFVSAALVRGGVLDGPVGVGLAALGAAHAGLKWRRLRRLGGQKWS